MDKNEEALTLRIAMNTGVIGRGLVRRVWRMLAIAPNIPWEEQE